MITQRTNQKCEEQPTLQQSAIYDDHLFGTKRQKILNVFYNQRWDIKNHESQGNYVWRMARPRKAFVLKFCEYCQVYKEELPRNINKPRTLGAVFLGPTRNEQGGFKFMSLTTGELETALIVVIWP